MKQTCMKFTPESVTITRRADGAWDMVALCGRDGVVSKVEVILDDASFDLVHHYWLREDQILSPWIMETIPPKVSRTDLSLNSTLRGGVGGEGKYTLRVTHVEGGCDAAE